MHKERHRQFVRDIDTIATSRKSETGRRRAESIATWASGAGGTATRPSETRPRWPDTPGSRLGCRRAGPDRDVRTAVRGQVRPGPCAEPGTAHQAALLRLRDLPGPQPPGAGWRVGGRG